MWQQRPRLRSFTHTLVLPVAMYRCESWIIKKANKKKIYSFEIWCWRTALWILWTTRKTKKSLEHVKYETLLEVKMTKLKALPQAHHEKAWFFGKHTMLGKIEGSKKRERPNMSWIDSMEEAIGMHLQELNRAVEDRTCWTSLTGSPRVSGYSVKQQVM